MRKRKIVGNNRKRVSKTYKADNTIYTLLITSSTLDHITVHYVSTIYLLSISL